MAAVWPAQLAALLPQVLRLEDAFRGDDAGDEFGRCDVEAGIARVAAGIGHTDVDALASLWLLAFGISPLTRSAP